MAAEGAHDAVHRIGAAEGVEHGVGRHVVADDHHQGGAVGEGGREPGVEEAEHAAPPASGLVRLGQRHPLAGVEAAAAGRLCIGEQHEQLRSAPRRERLVDLADHDLLIRVEATCVDGGDALHLLDQAPDCVHGATIGPERPCRRGGRSPSRPRQERGRADCSLPATARTAGPAGAPLLGAAGS